MSSSAHPNMPSYSAALTGGRVSYLPSAVGRPVSGTAHAVVSLPRTEGQSGGKTGATVVPARYKLCAASELMDTPPMAWLVKGLVPQQGLGIFYGPSGAGKSFLLLDMVCAIAEGEPWFGRRTTRAPVIYLCLEGAAGFVGRIKAWQAAQKRPFPELVRLVVQPFNLHSQQDVRDLLTAVKSLVKSLPGELGPPVIVVDTLNRAMAGADENGSADMGLSLQACALLVEHTKGLVLLAHHSGKDADRGPRGHSSLEPAADASIKVTRAGQKRHWESKKVKDGDDGVKGSFELETVVLGIDADGDEVTSCVVHRDANPVPEVNAPELSASLQNALLSLQDAVHQSEAAGAGGRAVADLEVWREAFYTRCPASTSSGKRNAFHRARAELQERGLTVERDGFMEVQPAGLEMLARLTG
ncbi:hypothetical protein B0E49_04305 [Polaromonas sp. C04]|nr:hypothetical protein B0E49_04305 [Polaromonas sp. C04]